MSEERRKGPEMRHQTRVPVTVIVEGTNPPGLPLFFSKDISGGGISIQGVTAMDPATCPVKEGGQIELSFALPFSSQFVQVSGRIIWIRHDMVDKNGLQTSMMGVQFVNPDPEVVAQLRKYLQSNTRPAVPKSAPAEREIIAQEEVPAELIGESVASQPLVESAPLESVSLTIPTELFLSMLQFAAGSQKASPPDLSAFGVTGNLSTVLEKAMGRYFRGLQKKEIPFLVNPPEGAESFRDLLVLGAKIECLSYVIKDLAGLKIVLDSSLDGEVLLESLKLEVSTVATAARNQVSGFYSKGQSEHGQMLTSVVNRVESALKPFEALLKKAVVSSNSAPQEVKIAKQIPRKSIKDYYDELTELVRAYHEEHPEITADDFPDLEIYGRTFTKNKLRAFFQGDLYWNQEERALVAGFAAMEVKAADEYSQLKGLFDNNVDITDDSALSIQDNASLIEKLKKRYPGIARNLATRADREQAQTFQSSMSDAQGQLQNLIDLNAQSKQILEQALASMNLGGAPTKFQKAKEVAAPKAAAPATKVKKPATKLAMALRAGFGVVMVALALLFSQSAWKDLLPSTPRDFTNEEYTKVLPLTRMMKWGEWLFGEIDGQTWFSLTPEERKSRSENLFERIKKDGYKQIEVRIRGGKVIIQTTGIGKEMKLRVNFGNPPQPKGSIPVPTTPAG